MSEEAMEGVRSRAAASSDMFSNSQFEGGWVRATDPLFAHFQ